MTVVRELQAKVSASGVQGFKQKMNSATDSIDELGDQAKQSGGAVSRLKSRIGGMGTKAMSAIPGVNRLTSQVDELEDELGNAGVQAVVFSGSMAGSTGALSTFATAATAASLAAGGLKTALLGIGLAALPALMGPLTIATGALTGFAGAIGLILGSGFLAWSNKSGNSLEKVMDQIKGLVAEFGQQFIPLINKAVNALPDFVYEVLRATGNLKPFVTALEDMGAAAFKFVPKLVGFFFQLGREALPILRKFGGHIVDNLIPALRGMKNQTEELGPMFIRFGKAVGRLLPKLFKLSNWVLKKLVPAATQLVKWTDKAFTAVDKLGGAFSSVKEPSKQAKTHLTGAKRAVEKFEGSTSSGASTLKQDFQNALGTTKQRLKKFASGLQNLASGEWKQGFSKLRKVGNDTFTDLRQFLVGESGNGGIMNRMITDAADFLKNDANQMLFTAAEEAWKSIENRAKNLKIILIGKSGSGGLINTMIGEIASYLKSDAFKTLLKAATKALGKGIRTAAIDLYNAIIGKEPSIIGDMIADIVSYLKTDAWGDLKEAATILFDAIIAAGEGLYDGLIGNSLIPEMIGDIVSYLKRDAAGDLKRAGKALMNSFKDGIEDKVSSVTGAVDDVVQDVRDYLPGSDAKTGALSDLTDAAAALPRTFATEMVRNVNRVQEASETLAEKAMIAPGGRPVPMDSKAGGSTYVTKNISIELGVPAGTDADTAARTYSDELKSQGFN